jgi:hypothetical protein
MRRRTVLAATTGAAVVTLGGTLSIADADAAVRPAARSALRSYRVQGSDLSLDLLPGPGAEVLVHVVRRFHYEIDTLRRGEVVADRSGTALDIRPGFYPAGVAGGFLPHQLIVIRDILAECDGMVQWGGDAKKPQESRFAIATRPDEPRLRTLAGRQDRDARTPARRVGANTAQPFTPARIKHADAMRRRTTTR